MRLRAHILAVLALLLVAAGSATATAATTTADPAPQELWRAYPLQPGDGTPSVRLPASSATVRPAPATARAPGSTGGGSPGWLLVVAIGAMTLLLGLLAGRRARRPQPAASAAAAPPKPTAKAAAATVAPARAQTAPAAPRRAPAPTPPQPRAAPTEPFPMPTEPRRTPPEPRAAPPEPHAAPPEPHAPPPDPVVVPESRRFRRVPWPAWSRALWRCEITHHYGVLHADLRVVAHEPGRHRGVEVLRTETHTRPGWGADLPAAELRAAVRRLEGALVATGWEPVREKDDEAAQRFIWPREGRPPLDRLAVEAATDKEDANDS
jgi:hypothetical protein